MPSQVLLCPRQSLLLTAPSGTPFEGVLEVDAYLSIRPDVRVGDRFEVRAADLSWWAELLAVQLLPKGVAVRVLQHHAFTDIPDGDSLEENSEYFIAFEGIEEGHVVKRKTDGQKMHSQVFATRDQAQDFLRIDLIPRAARNRFS
jgi:hypothetical protein